MQSNNCSGCQYRLLDLKLCQRELFFDQHCIFHSTELKKKVMHFEQCFSREFSRQQNEPEFNFEGFIFPEFASFKDFIFRKSVLFVNCKFYGNTADFSNTQFKGEKTSFIGCEFHCQKTLFVNTRFQSAQTYFMALKFLGGVVDFSGIKTNHDCYFNKLVFNQTQVKLDLFIKDFLLNAGCKGENQ